MVVATNAVSRFLKLQNYNTTELVIQSHCGTILSISSLGTKKHVICDLCM